MQVYIVYEIDGGGIKGVYSTEEKAEKRVAEFLKSQGLLETAVRTKYDIMQVWTYGPDDHVRIQPFEIDKP